MSREYTKEEVKHKFLNQVRLMIQYWEKQNVSSKDKLDGLAFSILNIIDGGSPNLPAFDLISSPHQSDKEFFIEQGKNYYPITNISGSLHDNI